MNYPTQFRSQTSQIWKCKVRHQRHSRQPSEDIFVQILHQSLPDSQITFFAGVWDRQLIYLRDLLLNCPGEGAHNCPRLFTTLTCIQEKWNALWCRRGSGRLIRLWTRLFAGEGAGDRRGSRDGVRPTSTQLHHWGGHVAQSGKQVLFKIISMIIMWDILYKQLLWWPI